MTRRLGRGQGWFASLLLTALAYGCDAPASVDERYAETTAVLQKRDLTPFATPGGAAPTVTFDAGPGPSPVDAGGSEGMILPEGQLSANASMASPVSFILWQNSQTGEVGFWPMSGVRYIGGYERLGKVSFEWQIAAMTDFTGDGRKEILWQNVVTGVRGFWVLEGMSYRGDWVAIGTVPPVWDIAGTADFNGDGKADILWQNRFTGTRGFWLMNGTSIIDWIEIGTVPVPWDIAGVGDFNGDNKTDIVWQNLTNGLRGVWEMNGVTYTGNWQPVTTQPLDWRVVGVGDFTGDEKPDWVFQHRLTGESGVWQVLNHQLQGAMHAFPSTGPAWNLSAVLDHTLSPLRLPTVTTGTADNLTTSTARLRGQVVPNGEGGLAWFEWGSAPDLAFFTSTTPVTVPGTAESSYYFSHALANLTPGKTFYYRMAGSNRSGTVKGATVPFTTAPLPSLGVPTLTDPENGSTGVILSPTFRWQAVTGGSSYRIMVATSQSALPRDADAVNCEGCVVNTTTNHLSLSLEELDMSLRTGNTYYWQVAARAPGQNGGWSVIWSFTAQPCDDCRP